jgi:hypothetical protein
VPSIVDEVLATPGQPLASSARGFMEPRFGRDFSRVRVHTDARAAESAQAVNAMAYTVGNDIVFDRGHYQPDTPPGRYLLAHELAHTVQQQGQDAASLGAMTFDSPGHGALEQEAEAAAATIVSMPEGEHTTPPSVRIHPAMPILSRARAWKTINPPFKHSTGNHVVTEKATLPQGPSKGAHPPVAFKIDRFHLPEPKKYFYDRYSERASTSEALEATIKFNGENAQAIKQVRDSTLRATWLGKVGWDKSTADEKWTTAGGGPKFPYLADGTECQMDHVLELQLGGSNIESNISPLNKDDNYKSGLDIWNQLSSLATELRNDPNLFKDPSNKPEEITLHFVSVVGSKANIPLPEEPPQMGTKSCLQVEANALGTTEGAKAPPAGTIEYKISVAGEVATLYANHPKPLETDLDKRTGYHRIANQLIPGLRLTKLTRVAADTKGTDIIAARVDDRKATRLPITLIGLDKRIEFNVIQGVTGRELRLKTKLPELKFTYPYLSDGKLQLKYNERTGVTGTGELTPTPSLLHQGNIPVGVDFAREEFDGAQSYPPKKLHSGIPGLRITKSALGIALGDELRATGELAFAYGPEKKPLLDGTASASVDATDGLVVTGQLNAHLPGVDSAQGSVEYRKGQWSGQVDIQSSQIKLPFLKSGEVHVSLQQGKSQPSFEASGSLSLELPGNQPATLSVKKGAGGTWIYSGETKLQVPSLGEVDVKLKHDGEKLSGTGKGKLSRKGLSGDIDVTYDGQDGFTGEGKLKSSHEKLKGELSATLKKGRNLSAKGDLTYTFSKNLEGTASVVLTEDQVLKVNGGIRLPNSISLFEEKKKQHTLFSHRLDIPIVGVSVGPVSVGLIARISGALEASYGIGPGTLQGVGLSAGGQFDLLNLSKSSQPEVTLTGALDIPAHAGLTLSIRGAVGLSAGVASVTGGISVIGSALLKGGLTAKALVQYKQGRFIIDVTPAIKGGLVLGLGLTADVTAEAGVGFLKYAKSWVWKLAQFQWDSGEQFGLIAPIRYDSVNGFTLPTPDKIQWIRPNINLERLLPGLVGRAKG